MEYIKAPSEDRLTSPITPNFAPSESCKKSDICNTPGRKGAISKLISIIWRLKKNLYRKTLNSSVFNVFNYEIFTIFCIANENNLMRILKILITITFWRNLAQFWQKMRDL